MPTAPSLPRASHLARRFRRRPRAGDRPSHSSFVPDTHRRAVSRVRRRAPRHDLTTTSTSRRTMRSRRLLALGAPVATAPCPIAVDGRIGVERVKAAMPATRVDRPNRRTAPFPVRHTGLGFTRHSSRRSSPSRRSGSRGFSSAPLEKAGSSAKTHVVFERRHEGPGSVDALRRRTVRCGHFRGRTGPAAAHEGERNGPFDLVGAAGGVIFFSPICLLVAVAILDRGRLLPYSSGRNASARPAGHFTILVPARRGWPRSPVSAAWCARPVRTNCRSFSTCCGGDMSAVGPRPLIDADVARLGWTGVATRLPVERAPRPNRAGADRRSAARRARRSFGSPLHRAPEPVVRRAAGRAVVRGQRLRQKRVRERLVRRRKGGVAPPPAVR